jgi:site-specific recombinase XerD
MVIKAVLSDNKKEDGTRRVNVYLYFKKEKALIPTDYYVKPSDWDNGVKKGASDSEYLNSKIEDKVKEVRKLRLRNEDLSVHELKDLYLSPVKSVVSIPEFIDSYAKAMEAGRKKEDERDKGELVALNKGKPFEPASIVSYKSYSRHIKNFIEGKRITWNHINESFYNEYSSYLRYELGFKENTIARAIKVLKKIMRVAMKKPYNLHSNTDFMDFPASYVDTDSIFLTEEEIEAFMSADIDKHLIEDRDRFFVSYNLFLRFGDAIKIEKDDVFIHKGKPYIKLMQAKTKVKPVIPLFPRTVEILEKYNYRIPETTNQENNWKLKEIGKAAKIKAIFTETFVKKGKIEKKSGYKYTFITTHTARRSMATNYYLAMKKSGSIDLKSLQLMGGWKSILMLEKYLKIGALENAIEASEHPFFN